MDKRGMETFTRLESQWKGHSESGDWKSHQCAPWKILEVGSPNVERIDFITLFVVSKNNSGFFLMFQKE